jgi:hypothetical protein
MSEITEFIFRSYSAVFFIAGLFQFLLSRRESDIGIFFPVILGVVILAVIAFMIIAYLQGIGAPDLNELVVRIAKLLLIVVVLTMEYFFVKSFF